MINIIEKYNCCGCEACVQRCPKQCISMREDEEGFLYPVVDEDRCIDCGLCEKVCPILNSGEERLPLHVYAAKNPDEQIRYTSSSGGVFTSLAESVVKNNGVVFGAAFNNNWEVEHQYAEKIECLSKFRGSKYVQSSINNTFLQVEMFLKQGREVLFSGTPCQVRALKLFLRKEYENLLTVDFICHGVPSPGVFRNYLNEEKESFALKSETKNTVSSFANSHISKGNCSSRDVSIESISFRDKRKGWEKFSFVLVLSKALADGEKNSVSLSYTLDKNPYLRGFLANIYLRPSCYSCSVRNLSSGSDITIADYWGISTIIPEWDDDKGVSAVVISTAKGEDYIQQVSLIKQTVEYSHLKEKNPALYKSSPLPKNRAIFFNQTNESFCQKSLRLSKTHISIKIKEMAKTAVRETLRFMRILEFVRKIRDSR